MSSLVPDVAPAPGAGLVGCWAADERLLRLRDKPVWVNVWFHFLDGGEALVSIRYLDQPPTRAQGRWRVEEQQLVASFGGSEIRAEFSVGEEVLRWAGETLLRLPDCTASLPAGIELPCGLSAPALALAPAPFLRIPQAESC